MSLGAFLTLLAALVLSILILTVVVAVVWWLDRYDREPVHLVMVVFLWGASVAPAFSVLALSLLGSFVSEWMSFETAGLVGLSLVGPVVEEIAKAGGLFLLVAVTSRFDNPTDGVVYGTAVGLGFAVAENVLYALAMGTRLGSAEPAVMLVVGRTVMSAGVHAVSSAAFGAFLGHAVLTKSRLWQANRAVAGLAVAVTIHGGWNFALTVAGPVTRDGSIRTWLLVLPAVYLAYGLVLAGSLASEHRILKKQLLEEVEFGTVPQWVAEVIPYYRRRIRGDWWPSRAERTVISRLLTRIAFRKHALRHLPSDRASIASLEVVRLRQRVRQILLEPDNGPD
ncbi:MAG: PrsW family intramembrane metalloprotease [Holophagae bacterium]